ncbi:protein-glutamate O-methyltransferase CheR [Shewanella sp.]|uniref:CheR family methyltransferase n=1 Tax=Shewanella sp. TaxID=50422 RepID=UPI001EC9141E|nr:protein-glutamate O-methyltransferase [Shewanella sp.]NRB22288.1 protein-glutamate O-methyltransferase [Shewanella sp.]
MTKKNFEFIQILAYEETGILLPERKKHMVYSRLSRRLRHLGLENFNQYCDRVQKEPKELMNFVNALTTNLTAFFREEHHFDYLDKEIAPLWRRRQDKRLRIWSSACSTGEEAYSIAMTLVNHFAGAEWDLKILATDLDTNVLSKAAKGCYAEDCITGLPVRYREKYMRMTANGIQMKRSLQNKIHFKQLNLLHKWPMTGPFDVIFCRNVLIYFDNETKAKIIAKFRKLLAPDGLLFIGHSETLINLSDEFELIGQTIYQPLRGGHAKVTNARKMPLLARNNQRV